MIVVELANGHIAQVKADKREISFLFGRNRRVVYFLTFSELEAIKRAADQDASEPAPAPAQDAARDAMIEILDDEPPLIRWQHEADAERNEPAPAGGEARP